MAQIQDGDLLAAAPNNKRNEETRRGRGILGWLGLGLGCGLAANIVSVSAVAYADGRPIPQALLSATQAFVALVYRGVLPVSTWAEVTVLASIPTMLGFLFAFFSEWKLTKKYPKTQRVQLCEEDRELLRRAIGRSP